MNNPHTTMKAPNAHICEIEHRLVERGISIDEMLRMAGVNRSTWTRWKSGLSYPNTRTWSAIGTAVDHVLGADPSGSIEHQRLDAGLPPSLAPNVPSAADFTDLEGPIVEAERFAELAEYVAGQALSAPAARSIGAPVTITRWEADMIVFAAIQAKASAERLRDAFYELVEASR